MATQPMCDKPVSVEEYLSTVYEHDCDYVDGVIEQRDLGEHEHAFVQEILTTCSAITASDHPSSPSSLHH